LASPTPQFERKLLLTGYIQGREQGVMLPRAVEENVNWLEPRDSERFKKVMPLEQNARMWRMNDIRSARYVRDYVVHLV